MVDLFTDEEQTIIKSAIYHHANKDIVHDEYDEMLKDSDILQRLSFDTTYGWAYGQRLLRTMQELLLPTPQITVLPQKEAAANPFSQVIVGDIAESLAEKHITGKKTNTEYMQMIRYFPEESAFDELKNAWCAAFVYHCCHEAGLLLPIRVPHNAKKKANCRFACVVAWYEWGNVSGIITRNRDDKIGCYIRIPKDYSYDGWKTDFKTGEMKIVRLAEE